MVMLVGGGWNISHYYFAHCFKLPSCANQVLQAQVVQFSQTVRRMQMGLGSIACMAIPAPCLKLCGIRSMFDFSVKNGVAIDVSFSGFDVSEPWHPRIVSHGGAMGCKALLLLWHRDKKWRRELASTQRQLERDLQQKSMQQKTALDETEQALQTRAHAQKWVQVQGLIPHSFHHRSFR